MGPEGGDRRGEEEEMYGCEVLEVCAWQGSKPPVLKPQATRHKPLVKAMAQGRKRSGSGSWGCVGSWSQGGLGPASRSQNLRLDMFTGKVLILQWHQTQSQTTPEMPHVLWPWPTKVRVGLWWAGEVLGFFLDTVPRKVPHLSLLHSRVCA